ncbi:protein FAR1-RELATED SEQUENCE 5-like [Chenopodium quinoa]|uniref:protein FAR1-RELATED SEQUENCE 5-like n=1 Tax=Chenopodium quinoa TaxID=63459 RepID=UPI000B797055|nr:protein FAR1-RELATED SEQUENCE 5-like [Chenopodium quinoa]
MEGSLFRVERDTYQEIYDLYSLHASTVGFSIRKHTIRYRLHTRIVTEKFYVCSAEGKRHTAAKKTNMVLMVDEDNKDLKQRKPRQVSITRTNCKASLRAKMNDDEKFKVVSHVLQHNHELTRKQWHYLHRSEREVTIEKAEAIKTMKSAGLSTMDTYNYMCTEANGEENLGHSVVDHLNFYSRLRMEQIEAGDAQTLVNILIEEQKEDPNFYFRVKFDKEGRISNIFWRYAMMLEDYKIYGDVLVFDTTYRTNRYNLICAPFVGIDNHWKNCMFACAFVGNEKTESFVWFLETFKKSMEFQPPYSLTKTRLWLLQLSRVYNLKEKWCPALSKDFFSAGILSSQRSESTNHAVGFRANKSTTLTEFYGIFVRTIKRWRSDEKYNEFIYSKSIAFTSLPLSGMLKHVAQVYPLSLFRDFEEEFGYSMATIVQILGRTEENIILYEVSLEEKPWSSQQSAQSNNNTASSSTSTTIPTILDPKRVVTKGRSKRAKGALEKGKKSKQKALPDPNSEFGSKTPTVRLF